MSQNDRGNQGRSEEDADDVRLMQLVGRGDTRAFEQLIEKHQTLVAGTIARMLGSSSDVEDIAQQVFIRVWKSARRYVPRAKFTTWLLKITRNLVFNCFDLVAYLSTAFTLEPGDVISTGTPGGVGAAMKPPQWLKAGDVVKIEIEQLGTLENRVIAEPADSALI